MKASTRIALAAGLVLLAAPASAFAGAASIGPDGISRYYARSGETNNVTVAEFAGPGLFVKTAIVHDVVPVTATAVSLAGVRDELGRAARRRARHGAPAARYAEWGRRRET